MEVQDLHKKIADLNKLLEEFPDLKSRLERTMQEAILGTEEETRKSAIAELKKEFPCLVKGFAGDNNLFMILRTYRGRTQTVYVCEIPRQYQNIYSLARNFTL